MVDYTDFGNDDIANAVSLDGAEGTTQFGTNVGYTLETDEPDAFSPGQMQKSAWFKYTIPPGGMVSSVIVHTYNASQELGSQFDTIMVLWRGTDIADFTDFSQMGSSDNDTVGQIWSGVVIDEFSGWVEGETAWIQLGGKSGAEGNYRITVEAGFDNYPTDYGDPDEGGGEPPVPKPFPPPDRKPITQTIVMVRR